MPPLELITTVPLEAYQRGKPRLGAPDKFLVVPDCDDQRIVHILRRNESTSPSEAEFNRMRQALTEYEANLSRLQSQVAA